MKLEEFLKFDEDKAIKYDLSIDIANDYCRFHDKAIKYDLSIDIANDYCRFHNSSIDKFFKYQEIDERGLDPDVNSSLLQEIYETIWDKRYLQGDFMHQKKDSDNWIWSDCMTSTYLVTQSVIKAISKKFPYGGWKRILEIYEEYGDSFENKLKEVELESYKKFIGVYHSLGNYCPVPCGFNEARSGDYGSHEYWDIILMKIYEFYSSKDTDKQRSIDSLVELLHKDSRDTDQVQNCKKWLTCYKNWHEFIDKNFFQDYVDENYNVKPFFQGHTFDAPEIPEDKLDEFFKEVSERILLRGGRMFDALLQKQ